MKTLAADDINVPPIDETILQEAFRRVFRRMGRIDTSIMSDKRVVALVNAYADTFTKAIRPTLESGVIPPVMAEHLRNDVFVFSGFKTYQELKEAAALLIDEQGQTKDFDRFYRDITAIKEDYNKHWLKAEYIFAQTSAEMAAKWKEFEEDGDRYNLQYRTAHDNRVRPEHRVLHGITLPPSDPFWDEFFPPNGWRCRCTVVQVRKGKYPESDSATAIQQGREATYQAGKNGVNKAAIFRYNPGKQQVIFPPHHPYYEVSESLRKKITDILTGKSEKEKKWLDNITKTEEALGIRKGSEMNFEQADGNKPNPNYIKNRAYQINCQSCVVAYELRRRGFDVEAFGNTGQGCTTYKLSYDTNLIDPNTGEKPKKTKVSGNSGITAKGNVRTNKKLLEKNFQEATKEVGRYHITVVWNLYSGHIFTAERLPDGTLAVYDPQTGDSHCWERYLKALSARYGIAIQRVDNMLVNTELIGEVVHKV